MFRNREDGARQLAQLLKGRHLNNPLVLAIPRGGVVTGAILAEKLGAELDVVLIRKIGVPDQPELAMGAVAEGGEIVVNPGVANFVDHWKDYVGREARRQLEEIGSRRKMISTVRPRVSVTGRSVIVTDDGVATGSTMIAALRVLRSQRPKELIVAVPVAPHDKLTEIRRWCDEILCVHSPVDFRAVGQFYDEFDPVENQEVVELLRRHATHGSSAMSNSSSGLECATLPRTGWAI